MLTKTDQKFPTILKLWKYEIERIGRRRGLSFPPILYEMVNDDEMWEIVSYHGFPVRYHHWSWGQNFLDNKNASRMGSTVYELILNTEPCYAFLLDLNPLDAQKLVIAHAGCGHGDFFKNNTHCRRLSKNMHNVFADHATIIDNFRTEYGKERVDQFLEACMSLDTMIDLLGSYIERFPLPKSAQEEREKRLVKKIQSSEPLPHYMDDILNPVEFLEAQQKRIEEEERKAVDIERGVKNPPWPVRDIAGFMLLHAPLEKWQRMILYIIREEALHLLEGTQTKVMNEGWASYWHEQILVKEGVVADSELFPFARKHAGVLGSGGINPYQLGIAMWKDIRFRWDTGRHGIIYDDCEIGTILDRWDEFVISKYFMDRHGFDTVAFRSAWEEFSMFLQEMRHGRGTYPEEYFLPDHIVTEWLRYETAVNMIPGFEAKLERVRVFERDVDALLQDLIAKETFPDVMTPNLLRFQAWHDCFEAAGELEDFLWTSAEIERELRYLRTLASMRERWNTGTIRLEEPLPIPQEWCWWAKKHPDAVVLGKGDEKIFEVRRTYNDISFIEEFFTQAVCDRQQYFVYGIEHDQYIPNYGTTDVWAIRSRNYERVKKYLIGAYLNFGMPQVEVTDANFNNNRELYVAHLHDGRDLERSDLLEVLRRLWIVWGSQKTVHIETIETEWPKKVPWWQRWRPPWYPPPPPQELKRKKIRFTCVDGKNVSTSYL